MNFSHILINSMIRSGGSLVARLFDGHPELLVMPSEMQYSRKKVAWPNWEYIAREHRLDVLCDEMRLDYTFGKLTKNKFITKDLHGRQKIDFDYAQFLTILDGHLQSVKWTPRQLINSVMASYYMALNGSKEFSSHIKYGVNHLSMMCFADPFQFFDAYPDGFILQPVRDPRSWYASMVENFQPLNRQLFRGYSVAMWLESTLRAIIHSRAFAQYEFFKFDEMVARPALLAELAERTGIDTSDRCLEQPTMRGESWQGNSIGKPLKGVDASVNEKWKSELEQEDVDFIMEQCQSVMDIIGFQMDGSFTPPTDADECYVPLLKSQCSLSHEGELQVLRAECRRMSLWTHTEFNEMVMKFTCGRFIRSQSFLQKAKGVVRKVVKGS